MIALIHGEQLIGVFNTDEEALAEGARQFGLCPFLVRRIPFAATITRREYPEWYRDIKLAKEQVASGQTECWG